MSSGNAKVDRFSKTIMECAKLLEKLNNGVTKFVLIRSCGGRKVRQKYAAHNRDRRRKVCEHHEEMDQLFRHAMSRGGGGTF